MVTCAVAKQQLRGGWHRNKASLQSPPTFETALLAHVYGDGGNGLVLKLPGWLNSNLFTSKFFGYMRSLLGGIG